MDETTFNEAVRTRTIPQMLQLWVEPEILRRQEEKRAPKPFPLRAAQVVFYADGRPPLVRLNEEARIVGIATLARTGASVAVGDVIPFGEIERVESFTLDEDNDPNCGHMTFFVVGGKWHFAFDFRYNKSLARRDLEDAATFLQVAEYSLRKRLWPPFYENLFLAAERTARAMLVQQPARGKSKGPTTHSAVKSGLNRWAALGNVERDFVEALNMLSDLRKPVIYRRSARVPDIKTARATIRAVRATHEHTSNRLGVPRGDR